MVKWMTTFGVMTMLAFAGFTATTYTETVGDLTWSYTLDQSGNATLTGVSPVPEELELPSALNGYPVIAVGASSFQGLGGLAKVVVPDSVTSIGAGAFGGCTSLGEVVLGDGVRSFGGGTSTGSYDDGYGVFNGCTSLSNVVFGAGLKTMNGHAFANCTRLTCVDLPDNVETVANNCFYKCTGLREVTFGTGIKTVGAYAFNGCTALQSVTFAANSTPQLTIGASAFNGCSALRTLTLPESLTSIAEYAFAGCAKLLYLRLPDSLATLSWGAFGGCTSLGEVVLGDGVASFGGSTSTGSYDDGYGVFNGCTSLSNVVFGAGLKTIGGHAFANCVKLTKVVFPENLDKVGNNAFYNCTMLGSVSFGPWVNNIGAYAFGNCPCLRYLQFRGDPPQTVADTAFSGMKSVVVIYVPVGADAWGNAWKGHVVKKVSEIPADADAPWDVVVRTLYLGDVDEPSQECVRFLEGDPIYTTFEFEDAWKDADIDSQINVTLSVADTSAPEEAASEPYYWESLRKDRHAAFTADQLEILQGLPVGEYELTLELNRPRNIRETDYDNNFSNLVFAVVPSTTITFMSLDEEVAVKRFATGGTFDFLPAAPVRLGYKFLGWFTAEEDGVEVTSSSRVPDNPTIYYAQWIAAPNETITVSANPTRDTTWQSGNLYIVPQSLTIPSGVTLTVMPGATVKFAEGASLTVANGATLQAIGSRAMPIVFTSMKDDAHSGDSNGDGKATMPAPGDWDRIGVSGTAVFDHCSLLYGSLGDDTSDVLTINGGSVSFANGSLMHVGKYAVGLESGHFHMNNSVIADAFCAFRHWPRDPVVNCVIYDCDRVSNNNGQNFVNCIVVGVTEAYDWSSGGGNSYQNCVFWNPAGQGLQGLPSAAATTGGNLWADPLFVDPENGNFRIAANSPCVDAGLGEFAPEQDAFGQPRMDVDGIRKRGSVSTNGKVPDIGIYEVPGGADVPAADLIVTGVSAPETIIVGDKIRVEWTVKNVGSRDAVSPWRDLVELVTDNGQVLLLGENIATMDVGTGTTVTFTGDFAVPNGCEGPCTVRVMANGCRDLFEIGEIDNNVGYSDECQLEVVELELPSDGTELPMLLSAGCETAFALGGDRREPVVLAFRSDETITGWLGNGQTAVRENAIGFAVQVKPDLWLMQVPAGMAPRVSLANEGLEPVSVAVSQHSGEFFLLDVLKTSASNVDNVTVPFCGNGFVDGIECWLSKDGAKCCSAKDVVLSDAVHGSAVFDMTNLQTGSYKLHLKRGEDEVSAEVVSIEAINSPSAHWNCGLVLADAVRANRSYVGKFGYENLGTAAKDAPYVTLKGSEGTLIRLNESDAWSESVAVLAISPTYPASSVKPGEYNEIPFFYKATGTRASVSFECAGATRIIGEDGKAVPLAYCGAAINPKSEQIIGAEVIEVTAHYKVIRYTVRVVVSKTENPVDWDDFGATMRPASVPQKAWNVAFPKIQQSFGPTWKTYIAKLAADADYLMRLGQPTYRVDRLLRLEMNEALGVDVAVPKLASATDITRTCRGLSLSFSRSYATALTQRQTKGVLGYGWVANSETYLEVKDEKSLVFHLPGGASYAFVKTTGVWAPEDARDRSILTETDSAYVLTALDGSIQTYAKSTLRLTSVADNQGHQVIYTYAGTRLVRAAHSDGQYLSFAYSGDLLTSVTDDLGHVAAYGYENDKLVTVTRPDGLVTHYVYRTDDGSAIANALVQTTTPDGTTRDFTWDENGRIATMSANGSHQTTSIRRGAYGSYVMIAPNGAETAVTVGVNGEKLKTVNALGEVVTQTYTDDALLESTVAPSGKRNRITYDKFGSPISSMSASGAVTSFSYGEDFGSLDSVTDAKGHAFRYGYDKLGRSVSVGYEDGSESTLEYNAQGDVVKSTNRRGQSVSYAYDAEGRLVRKTWDNGRTFTLAYDDKGNVTNAADSVTGAVTMEYDANERLTRIVHPKNRGFTFRYDEYGRQIERASLDGTRECYCYDAFGRLARVTDGTSDYLINTYDPTTGWLVTQTYGNGTIVSNAYDVLGRTVGIYHLKGGRRLAFFEYAYDNDGKCVSQTTAEGIESYTYDADGQLTAVAYPDGTNETFAYDAVGNRRTANGETYTVNELNQYTVISSADTVTTFTYDLDGNLTSRTGADGTTLYAYDTLNRLIAVTNESANIRWSCEYDVFGNRTSVTDNGTTTEKVYVQGSLASVAAEYVGNSCAKRHIVVGAVRLADVEGGVMRYYHGDMIGSARLTTDSMGVQLSTASFKVFGALRKSLGTQTDAGYVGTLGIETDANGLLFMRNRYYDAGLGRFVQMDPSGVLSGEINLYRYCKNSCVTSVDATGFRKAAGQVYSSLGKGTILGAIAGAGAGAIKGFLAGGLPGAAIGATIGAVKGGLVGFAWKSLSECAVAKVERDIGSSSLARALDWLLDFNMPGNIFSDLAALAHRSHDDSINYNVYDDYPTYNTYDDYESQHDGNTYWEDMKAYNQFTREYTEQVEEIEKRMEHDEVIIEYRDAYVPNDPNEIRGPAGVGERRFVQQGEWMNYTIYFENKTNATAAAQEVYVDLPMDENLDWTTLELGEIVFGDHIDTGLSGKNHGTSNYALPGTNTSVKTVVKQKNGVLSWYIRDWDPTTVDNFPTSVTGGFLPPNDPETHCGEGRLSYRVRVKDDAPKGAIIRASAQIVFDSNPMIETDPAWWNTVGEEEQEVDPAVFDSFVAGAVGEKGATYNGFLGEETFGGTFTLVVKKPKKGQTTASATLTRVDPKTGKKEKKIIGTVDVTTGVCAGGLAGLLLNEKGVGGTLDGLLAQGSVDAAKAKDQTTLDLMNGFDKSVYSVVLKDANGSCALLTATFSKKGKVKVAGTVDGVKISCSAQMSVGDRLCAVPFAYAKPKKDIWVSGVLWFDRETKVLVDVTGVGAGVVPTAFGDASAPDSGEYRFLMAEADVLALVQGAISNTAYEVKASFDGKKYDAGKPAKVKYDKKTSALAVDTSKGTDVSGLKLKYAKGAISGSFTVYGIDTAKQKLVKNKFTVNGVIVDGVGYGLATNKKLKPIPIEVAK